MSGSVPTTSISLYISDDKAGMFVKGVCPNVLTLNVAEAFMITVDLVTPDKKLLDTYTNSLKEFIKERGSIADITLSVLVSSGEVVATAEFKGSSVAICTPGAAGWDGFWKNRVGQILKDIADDVISFYVTDVLGKMSPSGLLKKLTDALDTSADIPKEDMDEDRLAKAISEKTKATIVKPKETLDDYICNSVLKEELEEIKDFFENASTYHDAGVVIPKGILFKGPPGTGKTYAARCIAGSVQCYFMQCTASSLQDKYIGSGAENIRAIFDAAKELQRVSKKGVILFVDEIDSFGSRETHSSNVGSEEDRTLNQLLAEMSGFEDNDGIMVLAATNYPERLDDALLRSGRFGRQITIDYPDKWERETMLQFYFDKIKMPIADTSIADISELTKNFTPADIKELCNEAGILSIRQHLTDLTLANINEAINKIISKDVRHPDNGSVDIVTAHECGHVFAEFLYNRTYSIKVTNFSYGDAGGFTQPNEILKGIFSQEELIARVKMLLGGRAAEKVICKYITVGASSDLAKAKSLLTAYFKTYLFESYKCEELDQIVIDKLQEFYEEVVKDFEEPSNNALLEALIKELNTNRTLYSKDICAILGPVAGGKGAIIL